jgi:hypothetical protein
VQLILAGHPTASIAARLCIAVGTVKNHRRRIYEKLDITTERELFLQLFQHQYRRPEDLLTAIKCARYLWRANAYPVARRSPKKLCDIASYATCVRRCAPE